MNSYKIFWMSLKSHDSLQKLRLNTNQQDLILTYWIAYQFIGITKDSIKILMSGGGGGGWWWLCVSL